MCKLSASINYSAGVECKYISLYKINCGHQLRRMTVTDLFNGQMAALHALME